MRPFHPERFAVQIKRAFVHKLSTSNDEVFKGVYLAEGRYKTIR